MERNEQLKDIKVGAIHPRKAREYIVREHYMKTFPNPSLCFGVKFRGWLVGVLTFGVSTSTEARVKELASTLKKTEYIEMQRMHLSDVLGANAESFVLGKVYELIKKNTDIKLLLTHAGGCKNDCGIVYQASSWLYFGKTKCDDFYLTATGEYKNTVAPMRFGRVPKEVSKKGGQAVGEFLWGEGELLNTFRYFYAMPLNKGLRRSLIQKSKEYPKDSEVFRRGQKWIT